MYVLENKYHFQDCFFTFVGLSHTYSPIYVFITVYSNKKTNKEIYEARNKNLKGITLPIHC